jgi:hypothetical protein
MHRRKSLARALLGAVLVVVAASSAHAATGRATRFLTTGPMGTATYRVDTVDGRVVSCEQVLNDESFRTLEYGAAESEVLARIGPPSAKQRTAAGDMAWVYHYLDTWGNDAEFAAVFGASHALVQKVVTRQNG